MCLRMCGGLSAFFFLNSAFSVYSFPFPGILSVWRGMEYAEMFCPDAGIYVYGRRWRIDLCLSGNFLAGVYPLVHDCGGGSCCRTAVLDPGTSRRAAAVLGAAGITLVELAVGCVVNLWWNMGVWDYSDMPMNLWGQICPTFSAMWFFLCIPAFWLCGQIRTLCQRIDGTTQKQTEQTGQPSV